MVIWFYMASSLNFILIENSSIQFNRFRTRSWYKVNYMPLSYNIIDSLKPQQSKWQLNTAKSSKQQKVKKLQNENELIKIVFSCLFTFSHLRTDERTGPNYSYASLPIIIIDSWEENKLKHKELISRTMNKMCEIFFFTHIWHWKKT